MPSALGGAASLDNIYDPMTDETTTTKTTNKLTSATTTTKLTLTMILTTTTTTGVLGSSWGFLRAAGPSRGPLKRPQS